ncbi:MAG: hypothetical protein JNL08_09210 [Planctomycetes bacterium]|nr:hypothetical protein [Planctomycetota bacterium]
MIVLAVPSTLAVILALAATLALVVYGLFAWERIVRRRREQLPGTT